MDKPVFIYCYDAWCGWCFGFSPVIKKIAEEFKSTFDFEVLSGGMIIPAKPTHIRSIAGFISSSYKNIEDLSGVTFGKDYLWHIHNPEESDWHPHSEKAAIALCIFKEFFPLRSVEIASDLQYALFYEGRDLTDDEAYLHLLEKYSIHPENFFEKLRSETYREMAYYEFALMKQLEVNGYPTVFIQTEELKFNMMARGYTDYDTLKSRIINLLQLT